MTCSVRFWQRSTSSVWHSASSYTPRQATKLISNANAYRPQVIAFQRVANCAGGTFILSSFGQVPGKGCLGYVACLNLLKIPMQGHLAPSSSDSGSTGSLVYDFYWGMELYPRLGTSFDLKTWTNCRMGMMGWGVLTLCYTAKQLHAHGHITKLACRLSAAHAPLHLQVLPVRPQFRVVVASAPAYPGPANATSLLHVKHIGLLVHPSLSNCRKPVTK